MVCIDADTRLPENAVGDWVDEFYANPRLGGSSSSEARSLERDSPPPIRTDQWCFFGVYLLASD